MNNVKDLKNRTKRELKEDLVLMTDWVNHFIQLQENGETLDPTNLAMLKEVVKKFGLNH